MEQIPIALDDVYSVSDLNSEVKWLLDTQFGSVWVEGEISNLMRARTGHMYFSLKDSRSQLRCAMFRNDNRRVEFQPADGQKVLCRGRLGIYEQRGDYQLIVDRMNEVGVGALQQKLEATKQRLHKEGLFDESKKQALPAFPRRIGLITSPTGAALQDALNVLRRRYRCAELIVYPVTVQGEQAAPSIVRMLEIANRRAECDVLLLMRGGGSLEDLWAFNEEPVARAVFASDLPIISGVGHEVDYTITDLVADLRAPTPSAAAELVSPDQKDLQAAMANMQRRLVRSLTDLVNDKRSSAKSLTRRLDNQHPSQRLRQRAQRCDELDLRLQRAMQLSTGQATSALDNLKLRLLNLSPGRELTRRSEKLQHLHSRLGQALLPHLRAPKDQVIRLEQSLVTSIKARATRANERLASNVRALQTVSPLNTLARGYAIVQGPDGEVITRTGETALDQKIRVRVSDGEFGATVDKLPNPGK